MKYELKKLKVVNVKDSFFILVKIVCRLVVLI